MFQIAISLKPHFSLYYNIIGLSFYRGVGNKYQNNFNVGHLILESTLNFINSYVISYFPEHV